MSGTEKKPEQTVDPSKKVDVQKQLENQHERTKKAMDKVGDAYDAAMRKIRTPLAALQQRVGLDVLGLPLVKLGEEIDQAIIKSNGEILQKPEGDDFEKRRTRAVDAAVHYINKMAAEGGLNAEAVSRMISDENRRASRVADLLIKHKYPDIEQAMLFALGSQGDSSSLLSAGKEAEKTVLKFLESDFEKPNSDIMPYIWTIFSFMEKDSTTKVNPKITIAKAYLKGKSPAQTKAFLQKGNAMGVFDWKEMQELNPSEIYTAEEVKDQEKNWQAQNDYKKQAAALGMIPYGTENVAGKNLTVVNALLTFVKFGAGVTVLANFITGSWQGGKFQGLGASIKRILSPQSALAIATWGAIRAWQSPKTRDQLLEGITLKKRPLQI